jgi:hypothetical protein
MQTGEGYIPALHSYLRAMDYEPADNIGDLAMQVMYARNEQVQDLVDKYDPDCYDEVAVMENYDQIDLTDQFEEEGFDGENYDDYKKRKLINYVPHVFVARQIAKGLRSDDVREQKRAFRKQKQAIKEQTVLARKKAKLEEALHPERQAPNEGKPLALDMSEGEPIDSNTANAEIVGEEMERDTYGDMETFLPALGGIVALGTQIADAKKKGKPINVKVAWGKLKDLFKKKSPAEKAKIASELNLPATATNQDVLNTLVSKIEADKKEDYLRKNAPMIGLALIAIVLIAFFMGRKS